MERVLHAIEKTALNPDPLDLGGPDFVTPALVGLGTMRQGSDVAPAVPMSGPVRPAAERKRGSSFRSGCRLRRYRRPGRLPDPEGPPPLAPGRDRGRSPAGVSPSFAPEQVQELQDGPQGRPDGWVIPLTRPPPFPPCYPGLADGQGSQRSADTRRGRRSWPRFWRRLRPRVRAVRRAAMHPAGPSARFRGL